MQRLSLSGKTIKEIKKHAQLVLPEAWAAAHAIWKNPELAFQEKFASALLSDFLGRYGFKIEREVAGLETAFRASLGGGKARPRVAFLAEMDALPGLGHACGHHLIGSASAGAAAVLAMALPDAPGRIEVIGCPAEEQYGGKVMMADRGVFDEVDAAFLVHPEQKTEVYKRSLGVVNVDLTFKGKSAHAAAEPHGGINALDALIQTFNAVNVMRQQTSHASRIHGIVTHGGVAPNIIPDLATASFMARGTTVKETREMTSRLVDCAKGAARAAGARLKVNAQYDLMYAPYVPSRVLGEVFRAALAEAGVKEEQGPEDEGMGSTDVGNVGLHAPVIHPVMAIPGARDGVHTKEFARAGGTQGARVMLGNAILCLALAGAETLLNPRVAKDARTEHRAFLKETL